AAVPASANIVLGPEVPFPFGTEVPFPWDTIQGVWRGKAEAGDAYSSFEVQPDMGGYSGVDGMGANLLTVKQIDPDTGEIVAEGFGTASTDERVVRALMTGKNGSSYYIIVRAYNDLRNGNGRATVLTIRPYRSQAEG